MSQAYLMVSSKNDVSFYQRQTPIGYALVTAEGLDLLTNSKLVKKLNYCDSLSRTLERNCHLLTATNEPLGNLPGIDQNTSFLGGGCEGLVYSLSARTAVKIYHFSCGTQNNGFSGFERLHFGAKQDYYDVPQVYVGTQRILLMQNMSKYPDFFSFIRTYPDEADSLYKHIEKIANLGSRRIDYGDISGVVDVFDSAQSGGSVLVKDFDSTKKDMHKRYRLIVTDFC